jgi:Cupin domain
VPRAGDRYVMPESQGEYLVVASNDETGGEYVEMEWTLPPGAFAPPTHRHPTQVEEYEVLEGSFEVMVDGEWSTLREGDSASVAVALSRGRLRLGGGRHRSHVSDDPGADRPRPQLPPAGCALRRVRFPTCSSRAAVPFAGRWRASAPRPAARPRGPDRDGALGEERGQLFEALGPAIAVERKAFVGRKRPLDQGDLGRVAGLPE